jgi:hypothetical protein
MATEYNVQDNINELEKCIKRNFYSTNIPTVGELVLTVLNRLAQNDGVAFLSY